MNQLIFKVSFINKALRAEFSIMNEKLDEFSREMHVLALQEEFSIVKFEAYIDKVRNFVSQVFAFFKI